MNEIVSLRKSRKKSMKIFKLKISPHLSVFCEKFPNWILTDFEPCVVKLFSCNLKMFNLKRNFNLEIIHYEITGSQFSVVKIQKRNFLFA